MSQVADVDDILHETRTRLRLRLPSDADLSALQSRLCAVKGVTSVRTNSVLRCAVVHHDGRAETRADWPTRKMEVRK